MTLRNTDFVGSCANSKAAGLCVTQGINAFYSCWAIPSLYSAGSATCAWDNGNYEFLTARTVVSSGTDLLFSASPEPASSKLFGAGASAFMMVGSWFCQNTAWQPSTYTTTTF
jgi:hypothetical protein